MRSRKIYCRDYDIIVVVQPCSAKLLWVVGWYEDFDFNHEPHAIADMLVI